MRGEDEPVRGRAGDRTRGGGGDSSSCEEIADGKRAGDAIGEDNNRMSCPPSSSVSEVRNECEVDGSSCGNALPLPLTSLTRAGSGTGIGGRGRSSKREGVDDADGVSNPMPFDGDEDELELDEYSGGGVGSGVCLFDDTTAEFDLDKLFLPYTLDGRGRTKSISSTLSLLRTDESVGAGLGSAVAREKPVCTFVREGVPG